MTGPVLPPGWIEARDPNTGQIYYANPTTKESSWEIPRSISNTTHQPQQHQHQHQQNHNRHASQHHPSTIASIGVNDDEKEDYSLLAVAREFTVQQAAAVATNTNHQHAPKKNPQHLELSSITCGQLVDLIQIQIFEQKKKNDEKAVYTPINPYNLPDYNPSSSSVISDATIDSKLDILFTQLGEFGYQKRS